MLEDEFFALSSKIFDIVGDESNFHLIDNNFTLEKGGYFFLFGSIYTLDLSKPLPDGSDYTSSTYFEFQFSGHKERLLTYRRYGNFNSPKIAIMDFEKRVELAKERPFISTHTLNKLVELFDNYPDTIRGSLRLHEE